MSQITPEQQAVLINFIYCRADKNYYWKDGKTWVKQKDDMSVVKKLKYYHRFSVEDAQRATCDIETKQSVDFVGEIAGMKAGVRNLDGKGKMLILQGYKLLTRESGKETPFLNTYLTDLLGEEQSLYFRCWLKVAFENIYSGTRRPLPVLAVVGPRDSGKSLLNTLIIKALGNRVADPYKFLVENSNFNHEIIGSEILMLDDTPVPKDPKARETFGQTIKNHLFAPAVLWEAKGVNGLTVKPVQVVIISCNDNNAKLIPQIGEDLEDKISLLKATPARLNGMTQNEIEIELNTELPAFLGSLVLLDIPTRYQNRRTVCSTFQNPYVLGLVNQDTPESRLLYLIQNDIGIAGAIDRGKRHIFDGASGFKSYFESPENQADEYNRKWLLSQSPDSIGRTLRKLSTSPTCPYEISHSAQSSVRRITIGRKMP